MRLQQEESSQGFPEMHGRFLFCFQCLSLLELGSHVRRDKMLSIAYSEELIFSMSATLQSTDRRHGIVGQECCHFQRDS